MDSLLAQVFNQVSQVVRENRAFFNAIDESNHHHGDHLVEIFDLAVQTLRETFQSDLPAAMQTAGLALKTLEANASAEIYANGLLSFAQKLGLYQVGQAELVEFVREKITDISSDKRISDGDLAGNDAMIDGRSGSILKALVEGLSAWKQTCSSDQDESKKLNMGALFELGIIYLQAKQRNGSKLEILADAAVTASPLNASLHHRKSGLIIIQAMLKAFSEAQPGEA
jgi:hypothetical protein